MDTLRTFNGTQSDPPGQACENCQVLLVLNLILQRLDKISDQLQAHPPFDDFDRQAYAAGLIWRDHDIPVRKLARQVGVTHSTLFSHAWQDVRDLLKARQSAPPDKSHKSPDERDDDR